MHFVNPSAQEREQLREALLRDRALLTMIDNALEFVEGAALAQGLSVVRAQLAPDD